MPHNLWDVVKTVLERKFVVLNAYIAKKETFKAKTGNIGFPPSAQELDLFKPVRDPRLSCVALICWGLQKLCQCQENSYIPGVEQWTCFLPGEVSEVQ